MTTLADLAEAAADAQRALDDAPGVYLGNVGDESSAEMVARLGEAADAAADGVRLLTARTRELADALSHVSPASIAASAADVADLAVSALAPAPLAHAASSLLFGGRGATMQDVATRLDATPGAVSFGYRASESVVKELLKSGGPAADVLANLGAALGAIPLADMALFAVSFAGMISGWRADADKQLVGEADSQLRRLSRLRERRGAPKDGAGVARLDGYSYARSYERTVRDHIFALTLWATGPGGALRPPTRHNLQDLHIGFGSIPEGWWAPWFLPMSLMPATLGAAWEQRLEAAERWRAGLPTLDAMRRSDASAADGLRSIEDGLDRALLRLVRDGAVTAAEVMALTVQLYADYPGAVVYRAMIAPSKPHDDALQYALASPGQELWGYWAGRAATMSETPVTPTILKSFAADSAARTVVAGLRAPVSPIKTPTPTTKKSATTPTSTRTDAAPAPPKSRAALYAAVAGAAVGVAVLASGD